MSVKTFQEKNTNPMEKELAKSDIPVKRKIKKNHPKIPYSIGLGEIIRADLNFTIKTCTVGIG